MRSLSCISRTCVATSLSPPVLLEKPSSSGSPTTSPVMDTHLVPSSPLYPPSCPGTPPAQDESWRQPGPRGNASNIKTSPTGVLSSIHVIFRWTEGSFWTSGCVVNSGWAVAHHMTGQNQQVWGKLCDMRDLNDFWMAAHTKMHLLFSKISLWPLLISVGCNKARKLLKIFLHIFS